MMTLQEALPTGRTAWAILCPSSSGESPVSRKFILSQNGNSPHLGAPRTIVIRGLSLERLRRSWYLPAKNPAPVARNSLAQHAAAGGVLGKAGNRSESRRDDTALTRAL